MKRSIAAVATAAAAALPRTGGPGGDAGGRSGRPCYRETDTVLLPGSGFTPNARVDFAIRTADPAGGPADPGGPRRPRSGDAHAAGPRRGPAAATYMATDSANPALTGEVSAARDRDRRRPTARERHALPAVDDSARAASLTAGSGSGRTRADAAGRRTARTVKHRQGQGRLQEGQGAQAHLLRARPAPGGYMVQFDAYRRYKTSRSVKSTYIVTVFRTVRPAASAASGSWRRSASG